MIAGKNEPPESVETVKLKKEVKKLRKTLLKAYAETVKIRADLKASKRQAKSKVASDIESPPAT